MNSDSQGGKTAEAQEHLPPAEQFLYLPPSLQPYAYRIVNKLFYNRVVKKPDASIDLPRGSELPASFRYVGADGVSRSIGEFLNHNVVSGLLVLKNGQIVLEKYGLGLKDSDRWSTMSTVKSITAMLVGAAIKDGAIRSLDDTLETYLPKLAESKWANATMGGTAKYSNDHSPQLQLSRRNSPPPPYNELRHALD